MVFFVHLDLCRYDCSWVHRLNRSFDILNIFPDKVCILPNIAYVYFNPTLCRY